MPFITVLTQVLRQQRLKLNEFKKVDYLNDVCLLYVDLYKNSFLQIDLETYNSFTKVII